MTLYLLIITLILQPGAMVWDFQDNRFKPLQVEVREELAVTVHSPLEARARYEEVKARWTSAGLADGAEAELYIVDRKAGLLVRIPLPTDIQPSGGVK